MFNVSIDVSVVDKLRDAIRTSMPDTLDGASIAFMADLEGLWGQFIDDPTLGFGSAPKPGIPHQINYTGRSKQGIHWEFINARESRVREGRSTLEKIRMGTPPGDSKRKDVFIWAFTKIMGRDISDLKVSTAGTGGQGAVIRTARAVAARIMREVEMHGTSAEYERTRQFGGSSFSGTPQSNRGFDYPGAFLYYNENEITTMLGDAEDNWGNNMETHFGSRLP